MLPTVAITGKSSYHLPVYSNIIFCQFSKIDRLNYCHVSSLTPRNWTFPKSLRVIFVHGSLGHLVAGCTSSPDWPTHENDIFHPSPIMVTLPRFEYIGHKSGMCPFCVILNRCSRIESLGMHPTYKHNTQVVH